jgi:hypothetical protein
MRSALNYPHMGTGLSFDIARTALLAMDCQTGIVSIYAKPPEEFLERAATVLRLHGRRGCQLSTCRSVFDLGYQR